MAAEMTKIVDNATKACWPEVQRAHDATTRSMAELAGLSEEAHQQIEMWTANRDGGLTKRRTICQEVVWALARMGYLRSVEDATVIAAAKRLSRLDEDNSASDEEIDDALDDLSKATKFLPDYRTV